MLRYDFLTTPMGVNSRRLMEKSY